MPEFAYIAMNPSGRKIRGVLAAQSANQLAFQLQKKSLTMLTAKPVKQTVKETKVSQNSFFTFSKPIKSEDIIVFFRQLSTMVDAGVQLVDSLDILQNQSENPSFKKVIAALKHDLEGGENFSRALSKHEKVFSTLAISMVKAAEIGGNLAGILNQLATYVEDKDKIEKKIKSAVSYPKFIMIFFLLVVGAVMFALVPKFQGIFASFGAELPKPTLIIIAISNFLKNNILYEIIFVAAFIIGFKILKKNPKGRLMLDTAVFRVPIFGNMLKKSVIARFSKTLGTLTRNNVSLVEALSIAAETSNNVLIIQTIDQVRSRISGGSSLGKAMQEHVLFPEMMVKMIAVGEEAGSLEVMLEKVAEFYDRQFNASVDSLSSVIEPILMIGLGVLALVVVIALYLPIFQMTGAIHG
ncbi:MAG TPA: type II secretion system F family protein [Candidatus Marinimicrobia bacterium]|nr:type II secretion system F family protein [Candidatus Neomarinimicrobiota bacterium]